MSLFPEHPQTNMDEETAPELSIKMRREKYRLEHEQRRKEMIARVKKDKTLLGPIQEIIIEPDNVDMNTFTGTETELTYHIESLYANYHR
jgi:hypothetical protein